MRTNIVGTHWLCVTWYCSMHASACFGIELLHHDHGAAEAHRAHAVEERRRVVQRRGREVHGVLVHAPDRRSSSPSRAGCVADDAGARSCSARPSAGRSCPTSRASACPRAPRRAARPGTRSTRVLVASRSPSTATADHEAHLHAAASCRASSAATSRNVSEITSTCASQSSRMYAVSSALKCQLMHV